jgi:hypothetical protein
VVLLVAPAVVVLIRTTSVGNTGVEARRDTLRNSLVKGLGVLAGHCKKEATMVDRYTSSRAALQVDRELGRRESECQRMKRKTPKEEASKALT